MAVTASPLPDDSEPTSAKTPAPGTEKARSMSKRHEPDPHGGVQRKWHPLTSRTVARRPGTMQWRRRFPGTAEHVSTARHFTDFLFTDTPIAANAAWVTGELATNAIRHSRSGAPGGTFTVELYRWPTFGEIHLIDAGGANEPRLPTIDPVQAALGEGRDIPESGLGLYGIGALVAQYGTYRHGDGTRVVWARLRFEAPVSAGAPR
jgi:anti-sigma regulatory factor (Ser/Thr protein kinase)